MFGKLTVKNGFTLIELMIVVVIIGILASLAIPRFSQAAVRSKQGEAKLVLKQICTNQLLHRASSPTNDYFNTGATANSGNPNAFMGIDVQIAPNARYDYTITTVGQTFVATARANLDSDATVDTWTINQDGDLLCPNDDSIS